MAVIMVGVGPVRFFFIATVSVSPIRQTVSPESEQPASVARGRPLCKKVKSTPERLRENESARERASRPITIGCGYSSSCASTTIAVCLDAAVDQTESIRAASCHHRFCHRLRSFIYIYNIATTGCLRASLTAHLGAMKDFARSFEYCPRRLLPALISLTHEKGGKKRQTHYNILNIIIIIFVCCLEPLLAS